MGLMILQDTTLKSIPKIAIIDCVDSNETCTLEIGVNELHLILFSRQCLFRRVLLRVVQARK